jgi:hypothetical protein
MPKGTRNNGHTSRPSTTAKYDAHHTVLEKTYGALADLRRELADSKAKVAERTEILNAFAQCKDSQRAWLLLEDYFEKLSLARKDFTSEDWWPRLLAAEGATAWKARLCSSSIQSALPTSWPRTNFQRFAELRSGKGTTVCAVARIVAVAAARFT